VVILGAKIVITASRSIHGERSRTIATAVAHPSDVAGVDCGARGLVGDVHLERALDAVQLSGADDLSILVDAVGSVQNPTGLRVDQGVEVDGSDTVHPHERALGSKVGEVHDRAHHLASLVDVPR